MASRILLGIVFVSVTRLRHVLRLLLLADLLNRRGAVNRTCANFTGYIYSSPGSSKHTEHTYIKCLAAPFATSEV